MQLSLFPSLAPEPVTPQTGSLFARVLRSDYHGALAHSMVPGDYADGKTRVFMASVFEYGQVTDTPPNCALRVAADYGDSPNAPVLARRTVVVWAWYCRGYFPPCFRQWVQTGDAASDPGRQPMPEGTADGTIAHYREIRDREIAAA
jgi:hypothetical protein